MNKIKKCLTAALAICFIFVLIHPAFSFAAPPPELMRHAKTLFNKGHYLDAAGEYQKAVEADPEDVNAHIGLGLAYYQAGKLGMAMNVFEKVVQLDPKDRRGWNYLGLIYMELGLNDEGLAAFKKLTELDPSNAEAITNLGAAYFKKGDLKESMGLFRKALSMKPFSPLAHKNLGFTYAVQKKWPEAIDELALTRTIDAQYRDVEFMLRDITAQAVPDLEKREKESPGDPWPHYYLAYAAAFRGSHFYEADWKRANEEINKAAALAPKDAKICTARALILTLQSAFPQAIAASRECVKLDPNNWEAWKGLAEEELALGNADEGLEAIAKAAAISPDIISVQENLGVAWSEKVNDEKALEHLNNAVKLGAKSGILEFDLSITYHNMKNFDMAWRHARRAQLLGYTDADELIKALEKLSKEPEDY